MRSRRRAGALLTAMGSESGLGKLDAYPTFDRDEIESALRRLTHLLESLDRPINPALRP